MRRIILLTSVLILFICGAYAQPTESQKWTRLESDTKDFSITIPSDYQVLYDKSYEIAKSIPPPSPLRFKLIKLSDIRYITSFQNGASFLIESYKIDNLQDGFDMFDLRRMANEEVSQFDFSEFKGKMVTVENQNSYTTEMIVGSKNRIYRIWGGAKDKNNEALKYFLSSLKLNEKKYFTLNPSTEEPAKEISAAISSLRETQIEIERDAEDDKNPAEIKQGDNKKGVVFLYKLHAKYTEEARKARVTGKIKLRVTFSENGYVSKISVIKDLPDGLTENAVKAARLIRFLPQEIDNEPVTTAKIVEYSFTIY